MVHATFQFGGVRGKQTRLREAMLWRDSPAYRTEPRLLSIQLHQLHLAPAELDALTDEQMIAVHLTNMGQVLSQVCGQEHSALITGRQHSWLQRSWLPAP